MSADEPDSLPEPRPSDPWRAVALLTVAFVAWLSFQAIQHIRERSTLQAMRAAQEATIGQAPRIRGQFESITKGTLELAQQGNAGAALIVEELARRGVTINRSSPFGSAAPSPSK
jgi:hypothetical protein